MTKIDVKTVEGFKIVMEEIAGVKTLELLGFIGALFIFILVVVYYTIGDVLVYGADYTIPVAVILSLPCLGISSIIIMTFCGEKYFIYSAYTLSIEGTNISITVPKTSEQVDKAAVCNAVLFLESECRRRVKEKRDMQKIVWECK